LGYFFLLDVIREYLVAAAVAAPLNLGLMLVAAPIDLGLSRDWKDRSCVSLSGVSVAVSFMHHFLPFTNTTPS
jgi:hypothetical protein